MFAISETSPPVIFCLYERKKGNLAAIKTHIYQTNEGNMA